MRFRCTDMGCSLSSEVKVMRTDHKQLTTNQVTIVQDTWQMVKNIEETGVTVFYRLFRDHEEYLSYFGSITKAGEPTAETSHNMMIDEYQLSIHATLVMEAIGTSVECLDDHHRLTNVLQTIGRVHAQHGVTADIVREMWPAIVHGLKGSLASKFTDEVEMAWNSFFMYLCKHMEDGMDINA